MIYRLLITSPMRICPIFTAGQLPCFYRLFMKDLACRQLRRWPAELLLLLPIHVHFRKLLEMPRCWLILILLILLQPGFKEYYRMISSGRILVFGDWNGPDNSAGKKPQGKP